MAVKASYTITLVRVDDGTDATLQSATAPSDKTKLWCDTSVTPSTLKRWDGTKWTIVNDFEIGGRNLVLNTAIPFEVTSTEFNKTVARGLRLCPYLLNNKNNIRDRWITMSIDYKTTDLVYGTISPWIGFEFAVTGTKTMWLGIGAKEIPVGTSSGFKRYIKSFKIDDMDIKLISLNTIARDFTGTVELVRWKIEIGNKATDWTPAPEDQELTQSPTPPANKENLWCDTSVTPPTLRRWNGTQWEIVNDYSDTITNTKNEITTEYNAQINIAKKEINQSVSEIKTTTSTQSTLINSLQNQVDLTAESTSFIKTTLEQLTNAVDGKVDETTIKEWARFDGASLELGASNSPFKAILSNTELSFWQGNTKVAWISNNELHIANSVIMEILKVGNWQCRDEGASGLTWRRV